MSNIVHLFRDNDLESTTPKGAEIGIEIYKALSPLFKDYSEAGYSMRDVETIAIGEVICCALYHAKQRKDKNSLTYGNM